METYNQNALSTIHAASPRDSLKDTALGMVSTLSFPAIVGTADMMLKSAGVHLVGYEKIGSDFWGCFGGCKEIFR